MNNNFAYAIVFLASLAGTVSADSSAIAPCGTFHSAKDILADYMIGGYDVEGGNLYGWAGGALKTIDLSSGAVSDHGAPDGYSGYSSFVRVDPVGGSVWAGFTVDGNADDRIYEVDLATGAWTHRATHGPTEPKSPT